MLPDWGGALYLFSAGSRPGAGDDFKVYTITFTITAIDHEPFPASTGITRTSRAAGSPVL